MSFFNSALFLTWLGDLNFYESDLNGYVLSDTWVSQFMKVLFSSLITTNFIPYIKILIELLIQKVLRKKKRSKYPFPVERKYAILLTTICLSFMYAFALPFLFVYIFFVMVMINLIDRLLIVYWYKPYHLQSDLLNRTFLIILKYAPVMMFIISCLVIRNNNCSLAVQTNESITTINKIN